MDKRLLDILCCPLTRSPVRPLLDAELATLNAAIASGAVRNHAGHPVSHALAAALITRDGRTVYRVDDDIPVMLGDEAIAAAQIDGLAPA